LLQWCKIQWDIAIEFRTWVHEVLSHDTVYVMPRREEDWSKTGIQYVIAIQFQNLSGVEAFKSIIPH
jgi:hypothetical protein